MQKMECNKEDDDYTLFADNGVQKPLPDNYIINDFC